MEKIPTAEEFYLRRIFETSSTAKQSVEIMIEFARLHVEAALKAAYENHEINDYDEHYQYSPHLDKDSILNSYPLENIK